jgi:orotidine-5'-phosphate decarboxylase
MTLTSKDMLCFAFDVPDANEAQKWINLLQGRVGTFKVGLELFIAGGPALVYMVKASGAKCFLDLKLHDIPETVSRAVKRGVTLGADFMTIHTSGGHEMIQAAHEAAEGKTKILAVTALTSLNDLSCEGIYGVDRVTTTRCLMDYAYKSGATGFVCSAVDVEEGRHGYPGCFFLVPGIRPAGASLGDQKAVGTPAAAIRGGADLLVVGRPIRDAADPIKATEDILTEIANAL